MTLIAIGGAEGKSGDMTVLKRVLAEAPTADPRVLVITTATAYPEEVGQDYRDAFGQLGISCDVEHIATREMANDKGVVEKINSADVVFFTGGDQSKLARILNDTDSLKAVKARHDAGAVIAGTSAGAAAMSSLMICGGNPERAMTKGEVETGEGFSLVPGAVIDTHFSNRGRLTRLFSITAAAPDKTGIGLDEDTGIVWRKGGDIEVIGSGEVTLVDARDLKGSNISDIGIGEEIKAEGFRVTKYKPGTTFRLD
jgi:cyanophycinase